jgi:hypothetical protein
MLGRREFLGLVLALAGAPLGRVAAVELRQGSFSAELEILYGFLTFQLSGTIEESVDRLAGRYEVRIRGHGSGVTNAADCQGLLRDGRWVPLSTRSELVVHERESRLDVSYDWARRQVDYRSRTETFFLRRLRVADDRLTVPDGLRVDDVVSAALNFADRRWLPEPDGTLRTHVVRRHRPKGEGAEDARGRYGAELVPFGLRVVSDPETRRPTALFDLTRFSSWAREDRPARIVFGPDRRPEAITSSLMLGTSVTIRIARS